MIEVPNISDQLIAKAHRRKNGELAWRPLDAPAAVKSLAAAEYAVLGGEWWTILADGSIWPAVPSDTSRTPLTVAWSFDSAWDRMNEPWPTYCERASEYTIAVLGGKDSVKLSLPTLESEVYRLDSELWSQIWYNISFIDQIRYNVVFD